MSRGAPGSIEELIAKQLSALETAFSVNTEIARLTQELPVSLEERDLDTPRSVGSGVAIGTGVPVKRDRVSTFAEAAAAAAVSWPTQQSGADKGLARSMLSRSGPEPSRRLSEPLLAGFAAAEKHPFVFGGSRGGREQSISPGHQPNGGSPSEGDRQPKEAKPADQAGNSEDQSDSKTRRTSKTLDRQVSTKSSHGHKSSRHSNFFPQLHEIKSSVGEALNAPQQKMESLYFETGFWPGLTRHRCFVNFTLLVILLNTMWIAVDTDLNHANVLCDAPWPFILADNFFCTVFAFEIVARFFCFKRSAYILQDYAFMFDSFLVSLMIWEAWFMVFLVEVIGYNADGTSDTRSSSMLRIFRVLRLLRVARTGRLLNSVPELMILAKGMIIAVRSVVSILFLLSLMIYVFAIVFTQLLSGTHVGSGKFDNVPESMNFLLLQVLCGFDADVIHELLKAGAIYYVLWLIFLLLASTTIMNMLIGILCDVVATVAEVEKDEAFARDLEFHVKEIALSLDTDGSGTIDKDEFSEVTCNPVVVQGLTELGVDVVSISDYANFIFSEIKELSFDDFILMVSQFRGAKQATVKDMMDLRKYMALELSHVKESIDEKLLKLDTNMVDFERQVTMGAERSQPRDNHRPTALGQLRADAGNPAGQFVAPSALNFWQWKAQQVGRSVG